MLVDFGIAKVYDARLKTTAGARAITPGYSPQEQYGQGKTDARTDIYALGATLYTLLTGREPPESIQRNLDINLTPPRTLNPAISAKSEATILKAMEMNPSQRIQSAVEFKEALRPSLPAPFTAMEKGGRQTVVVQPKTPVAHTHPLEVALPTPAGWRRSWRGIAGLGLVSMVLFGLVIWGLSFVFSGRPTISRSPMPNVTQAHQTVEAHPTLAALLPLAPAKSPALSSSFKACQVTDTGGIDDKSFNTTAWKGVQDAMKQFGINGDYLESARQTDYEKNINAFLDEKCNIIITVGFLLGDATKAAAEKNPNVKFSIVDFAYDPTVSNIVGQVFAIDQAAFLAGYVAASVTKTGKVGTFGGVQIPTVTVFMDGFALGVQYYNQMNNTSVQVLGWDPNAQTGLFTGNFQSTDDGRTMGQTLMDEGADIIMPVAGPVGLGTAVAAKERGKTYIIGVDADWVLTNPDYADITFTSVMKNMDVTTVAAIKSAMDGTFKGGTILGTLENGGVGLAPFHDFEPLVSAELNAELEQLRKNIIDGKIATTP
jgi:basic membrane protein A and related proteins